MIALSTFSNALWRKSSRSVSGGNCVEISSNDHVIGVRDSKNPNGPVMVVAPVEWTYFLAVIQLFG
jgi:Domain of unknown function (DUF397)